MKQKYIIALALLLAIAPVNAASLVLDGTSTTLYGNLTYDYVELKNGASINVTAYNGTSGTGTLNITATYNITIDSTSKINGTARGYRGGFGGAAGGYGGGNCANYAVVGGGLGSQGEGTGQGTNGTAGTGGLIGGTCVDVRGAGGGGSGGSSGYATAGNTGLAGQAGSLYGGGSGGAAGVAYGSNSTYNILMGSGASGGGGSGGCFDTSAGYNGNAGTNGQAGGAGIALSAPLIQIYGNVTVKGGLGGDGGATARAGCNGKGAKGSGGSGGTLLINGTLINIAGSILNLSGGNEGATGNGASSKGADGRLKIFTSQLINSSAQITAGTIYYSNTTGFSLNVTSPTATNYIEADIWINATLNKNATWVYASMDGAANKTLTNSSGNWNYEYFNLAEGNHTVLVMANDSIGNIVSTSLSFGILNRSVRINTFDEETLANITFNVTFENSTLSKTWNNQSSFYQRIDNLTFGDTTITVASSGYETRYYYLTITSSTLVNMSAYLLATASGQTVRWHTLTSTEAAIINALVTAQKMISGSYVTVAQIKTDSSGTGALHMDPTANYQMVFTHPDYNTITSTITPSLQDYKVYMSTSTIINYTSLYDDIQIEFYPLGYVPNNATNQTFYYRVSSSRGTLTAFGANLTFNNTLLSSSDVTTSPSGGTVYLYSPLNQNGIYNLTGYFDKSGYNRTAFTKSYQNNIINSTNTSIAAVLTNMKSTDSGLGKASQGFISILVTLIVVASVSQYRRNGAGVLGLIVLGIFSLVLDWLPWPIFALTAFGVFAAVWINSRV